MSRTAKEIETTGLPCEAQNGETIQVVPKIDVTMFGKFTLKQEGMEVPHAVSLTGRSRRLWTLTAYLILNRNRGVSAQELIDLLWPEAESDNPLSTLQNNVSRARAALAELGFTHAKVIIHNEKGYYRWAPDRETQLDVEQFEALAKATLLNELRAGDPFTKVGANQFWVLLPGATGENGGLVSRRVFNRFQKEYPKSGAAYTFKSLDLRHIHMSAEEKATEKTERRKA